MTFGFSAAGIAAVVGGVVSAGGAAYAANKNSEAAKEASEAQAAAAASGADLTMTQFNKLQELLKPYADAGYQSLDEQKNILGLGAPGSQKAAYDQIANSEAYQSLAAQGENAMLQNASATGGLRGGNTQGALAQFRPALLSQMLEQQYSRLSGMTSIGQNAAANTGNAGMEAGSAASAFLGQQGAAYAGNALAQAQANQQMTSGITQGIGSIAGYYTGSKF